MFRSLLQITTILVVGLSAASAAMAQTGRSDPMRLASPTVPDRVGGNAAHGLCPVIIGNEDGPVVDYRRLPPC